jgi:hypothetical protein
LSNFQLLVLALISLTGAVWLSVKRTSAAAAPAVLAVIMVLLALGGPVWEWSKYSGVVGLPPTVRAAAFSESKAVPAFLWASIGAGLSALLVPPVPVQALPARKTMPSRSGSIVAAVVSAVSLVGNLVGEGPSFFRREVYLQSDGVMFLMKAAWPIGVVSTMLGIALTAREKDRRLRLFLIATAALWFIASVSTGSRTACALPMLGGALIIYNEVRRRRLHLPWIAGALAMLVTVFFAFSVVHKARDDTPHGLLNLPSLVQATASDMFNSTDSISLPVKQLLSTVYLAFPVAEESVGYDVSDVILDNANPLPGKAQPAELERYWPYEWTPLSFVGEWFGAFGWVGQVLIFGAMGWIFGLTIHNLQRSRFRIISFLPLGLVALTGVFSIEYSSRIVWRVISISVVVLIASYLVRERRRYMVRGTRDEQPWNAIGNLEESATRVLTRLATRLATIGAPYG